MAECHSVNPVFDLYITDSKFVFPLGTEISVLMMAFFQLPYHRENSLKPFKCLFVSHIFLAPTVSTKYAK